jgi:hypothetical protein
LRDRLKKGEIMFDLGGLGGLIGDATNSLGDAAQSAIPDGITDAIQSDAIVDGVTEQAQNISDQATDTLGNATENITDIINPFN